MRILCVGQTGWVGKHVCRVLRERNHEVLDNLIEEPEAIIYLPWAGLPNYESTDHYHNLPWQKEFLHEVVDKGIKNITVTGTCLETVSIPPHYAIAKMALRDWLFKILPETKWARLWYLYGQGQPDHCLLPSIRKGIEEGKTDFHVIDGERDFISVEEASECIVKITEQRFVTGIIDVCSGTATPVYRFVSNQIKRRILLTFDYPIPSYEPFRFHGDRTKLNDILQRAN